MPCRRFLSPRLALAAGHLIFAAATAVPAAAGTPAPDPQQAPLPAAGRPVHTYSIVARDARTGELGVAVQSHWFSVGPIVPWAESGVGAVATQSLVEVSYGPLGLERMRAGASAPEALAALVAADTNAAVRQVAMVDAKGRVAAHTGDRCIAFAGDTDRRGVLGAGKSHGERARLAGDGRRVREGRGGPRGAHARRARCRRDRRRRHPRQAVGRDAHRAGHAERPAVGGSPLRSAGRRSSRSRSPSSGGSWS